MDSSKTAKSTHFDSLWSLSPFKIKTFENETLTFSLTPTVPTVIKQKFSALTFSIAPAPFEELSESSSTAGKCYPVSQKFANAIPSKLQYLIFARNTIQTYKYLPKCKVLTCDPPKAFILIKLPTCADESVQCSYF